MPPEVMQMAMMKKAMIARTLILGEISMILLQKQIGFDRTYKDSQNSTSPYANTPRFDKARKKNQKIRIQPQSGTLSVQ